MAVAQRDATANWSDSNVNFGTQPERPVTSAAKSFGKGGAPIITHLPQGVSGQSYIDNSKSLAGTALNLNGVASRKINALLTLIQIVTRQLGDMPRFGAVEVHCAPKRKLMSPIAASNAIAASRSEAPGWRIEGVPRDDVDLGHFPPDLQRLNVKISEAISINADLRTIGLKTNARCGNAHRGIHVDRMPGQRKGHLDPNGICHRVQIQPNWNEMSISVNELARTVAQEAVGDVETAARL